MTLNYIIKKLQLLYKIHKKKVILELYNLKNFIIQKLFKFYNFWSFFKILYSFLYFKNIFLRFNYVNLRIFNWVFNKFFLFYHKIKRI